MPCIGATYCTPEGGVSMASAAAFGSPVDGLALPLSQCADPCFAQGRMGRGVLLMPTTTTLLAPSDAQIYFAFSTRHAVGLQTAQGLQFILHVGLDTHKLQGKGFQLYVESGDHVRRGDPLLSFDSHVLDECGVSPVLPFVFCNLSQRRLRVSKLGPVSAGEDLITIY